MHQNQFDFPLIFCYKITVKLCKRFLDKDTHFKNTVIKRNEKNKKDFLLVNYSDRVIFVPHCLRNHQVCIAKDNGSHYTCFECGKCKIKDISVEAKKLGYKGVYILKGGKASGKLIKELKPKAVLGVACFFEGMQGIELMEKFKLAVQFIELAKDGCVNIDVNLENLLERIRE